MLNISTQSLDSLLANARQCLAAGQLPQAEHFFRQALQLNPTHLDTLNDLGIFYQNHGLFPQAIDIYQKTILAHPSDPVGLNNLAVTLQHIGRTDEAIAIYQQFLKYHPNSAAGHSNLGTALQDSGFLDEALVSIRRALSLDPNLDEAASAALILLQYHPDYDARAIYEESRRWNDTFVKRLAQPFTSHANDRSPDRRLRIGYVSADFRDHSVGRFMGPLLAHHDHKSFEIFCYALSPVVDQITGQLRSHADQWRNIKLGLPDKDAATLIRQDQIDILVDLAMHTHGGRPLLFARKPAPVQVTYLAYAGTTGLTAIDYRLSDPYLDPPNAANGGDESCYSEKTVRLPQSFWCYQAPPDAPPLAPLPASTNGFITFGCLNNYPKINNAVLETWSRLLAAVKDSRLILFCPHGDHRRRVLDILTRHGARSEHVEFVTRGPIVQYFQHYQRIDIALDPFPYGGGTTSCDALWMGVPVITLRGNKPVARAGASILSNAGHPEFITDTPDNYLSIATQLASDLPRLADLRRALRSQMQSSPLMDAPTFTQSLESAYRQMWRTWCKTEPVA